jgi:hypothetical protein
MEEAEPIKIYYDTEFLENGETIRLISIGMLREDGKTLYRVVKDYKLLLDAAENPWIKKNVLSSLPVTYERFSGIPLWDELHGHFDRRILTDRKIIAEDVKRFVLDTPDPELWAYYAAYDHVAICQLFGRMLDLPSGFPMYTRDLKQEIMRLGNPRVPEQESGNHNALEDARWNKMTYEYLMNLQKRI